MSRWGAVLVGLPLMLMLVAATPRAVVAGPACTLVADAETNATLIRDGERCDARVSPASTFKVPLALIGFDSGLLQGSHEPAVPYDEEYGPTSEAWKTTIDPEAWLRESVVWYSQVLTRRLGEPRFARYVEALEFGNRDVTGDPGAHNGLTNAWLSSSLLVSAAEQVAFVRRLVRRDLPVAPAAIARTLAIMPVFTAADGWTVWGKTGTGTRRHPDGSRDAGRQFGWFVGWARHGNRTVAFARLVEDEEPQSTPAGLRARLGLLADLPALLQSRR
jgi:beta-lactamase class D